MVKKEVFAFMTKKIGLIPPDLWILMADQFKENLNFITLYHWNKL
jgi:hypothetical protein